MTDTASLKIFADQPTDRLIYVLDFMFKQKGQHYTLLSDLDAASSGDLYMAYSKTPVNNAKVWIQPSGLLDEKDISPHWSISFKENQWYINKQDDPLSIIFYFLSRYEEYTDLNRDHMGRFTAQQSVLFQAGQLGLPWCDIIIKNIWKELSLDYQDIAAGYQTILTYDIDIAWAYKYKPWWRTIANILKSFTTPSELAERLKVLSGRQKDPYDHYDMIKRHAKQYQTILFFLLGDYDTFDKNHHWKNRGLQALIKDMSTISDIGIHPSYQSFLDTKQVEKEQKRLAGICHTTIQKSRQHFLRMTLPTSYHILEANGITHDYSMGYAEHYGFRAGTAFPFYFFDLQNNSQRSLTVVPFTFMDGTLKEYMSMSPEEAILIINDLKKAVKSVGGQFIPLWHNHSIGNTKSWEGWQQVYKACLD